LKVSTEEDYVLQVIIALAVIGAFALVAWGLTQRSSIRRRDFETLRDERSTARVRARVVNRHLARVKGQLDLVLGTMDRSDQALASRDDRIMLEALRDQMAQLETEKGSDL
jgi:Flp pilus assembly protein TadB